MEPGADRGGSCIAGESPGAPRKSRRFGSYTLQAAIAAVHAEAESVAATDWRQIVALYDQLLRIQPSPIVQLNRAVAIAMCDGPEAGLSAYRRGVRTWRIGKLLPGAFSPCRYVPQARQDSGGSASYEKALALTQQEPERQFLQERIRQLK